MTGKQHDNQTLPMGIQTSSSRDVSGEGFILQGDEMIRVKVYWADTGEIFYGYLGRVHENTCTANVVTDDKRNECIIILCRL